MKNQKIIRAIRKLETVEEKSQSLNQDLLPRLCKDASDFELSKVTPTYSAKVMINLISILNNNDIKNVKAVLYVTSDGVTFPIFLNTLADAEYTKRKFKKIARLAFASEFTFNIEVA